MKKFLFLTACLVFTTSGIFAQSTDPNVQGGQAVESPQIRAQSSTDKINAVAQLTQDQYAKVLQVNRSFFSRARAGGPGVAAARLEEWREQQLKGIISPDQFQKVHSSGVLQE